jgi:hypothetical protein
MRMKYFLIWELVLIGRINLSIELDRLHRQRLEPKVPSDFRLPRPLAAPAKCG